MVEHVVDAMLGWNKVDVLYNIYNLFVEMEMEKRAIGETADSAKAIALMWGKSSLE